MTEAAQTVLREDHGDIAVLTLSNPERRNAFTPEMRRSLTAHLVEIGREEQTRAVIVRGADAHFCAGADLSRVDPSLPLPSTNATRENMKELHSLVRAIAAGPKPVIAAVEGIAAGGGLSIALACDHLVVAENARLVTAFAKLGLVGDLGIMWSLCQRVGPKRAKRLLMVPTELSGKDAADQGVADEVSAPGKSFEAALATAQILAKSAPLTVALTKAVYAEGVGSLETVLQRELDLVPLVNQSDEFKQALKAFRRA